MKVYIANSFESLILLIWTIDLTAKAAPLNSEVPSLIQFFNFLWMSISESRNFILFVSSIHFCIT